MISTLPAVISRKYIPFWPPFVSCVFLVSFAIIYFLRFGFCLLVDFVLFDPAGLSKTVWTLLRDPSLRPLESSPLRVERPQLAPE